MNNTNNNQIEEYNFFPEVFNWKKRKENREEKKGREMNYVNIVFFFFFRLVLVELGLLWSENKRVRNGKNEKQKEKENKSKVSRL